MEKKRKFIDIATLFFNENKNEYTLVELNNKNRLISYQHISCGKIITKKFR